MNEVTVLVSQHSAICVLRLGRPGYRGDYNFEVFNDDYQQLQLPAVAPRGAVWLAEDVQGRSVHLPEAMRLKA